MTKPELGTKRVCAGCSAKFYDLHQTPIVCPKCEAVFLVPKPAPSRSQRPFESRPAAVTMVPASGGEDVPAAPVKADGEKEAEPGVPLLEEIDED